MDKTILNLQADYDILMDELNIFIEDMSADLSIDQYSLDDECSLHPNQYYQCAFKASTVNTLYNKMNAYMKELKASIGIKMRKDPTQFGIEKVTENVITENVEINDYVTKMNSLMIDCLDLKNKMDALVSAFEHRRSMLNNIVQLSLNTVTSNANIKAKREDIEKSIERKKGAKRIKHE